MVVACPLTDEYIEGVPQEIKTRFDKVLKKEAHWKAYNFSALNLEEDCYLNSDHLNDKGAQIFTDTIIKLIVTPSQEENVI